MLRVRLKANLVREMLARRSLSQSNFASRIMVTGGYCSQLMSGDRCPSPKVRVKILKELKADFEDVFEIVQPHGVGCVAV